MLTHSAALGMILDHLGLELDAEPAEPAKPAAVTLKAKAVPEPTGKACAEPEPAGAPSL